MLLHLAFPGLLWLLVRRATVALAASFLLYLMVQVFSWHLPAWPSGELYFNPLAWQVLFVFGAWYAYEGAGRLRTIVQSRAVLLLAILYLVVSVAVALSWQIKALEGVYPRCGVKADLPDRQKSPCALAAVTFSRAGHCSLAADAARTGTA